MTFDGAVFEAAKSNAWRGDGTSCVTCLSRSPRRVPQGHGSNGVGKTTLLRVICGLLPAETGDSGGAASRSVPA